MNYYFIYTDGSKDNNNVKSAYYDPQAGYSKCIKINEHCSIFTAESYAIQQALTYSRKQQGWLIIMGGCRCTYRNCTVRSDKNTTDTKIHLFHYPAYERLRCHQWIINAQRYEFLDLKVSQLRNRVVCQHHFKEECFMNYKKEKLTFDAVPTEDGPYCDSTKEVMVDEEALEKANSVLNDIEQEITYIDKKANSSLKYIDFLANVDPPLVSEGINSLLIDDTKVKKEKEDRLIIPFEHPKAKENIKFKKKIAIVKKPISPSIKYAKYHLKQNDQITKVNEDIVPKNMFSNQEPNIIFDNNTNHNITNISNLPMGVAIPISYENIEQLNQQPPVIIDNLNHGQIINNNSFSQVFFSNNLQMLPSANISLYNQPQNSIPPNNDGNKVQKDVKVKIISEKTILEPLPFIGKLEPVLPSLILPVPNRLKDQSFDKSQTSQRTNDSKNIPIFSQVTEPMTTQRKTNNCGLENSEVLEKNDIVIKDPPKIEILEVESATKSKTSLLPNEQNSNTRESNEKACDSVSKLSTLKNKVSPERLAAIEKKRIFNKKLRDMVESCLEKPNDSDKVGSKGNILKTKDTENVDTSISKGNNLSSQDYTISYLESRMNKMQNVLLKKIEQNSTRIMELKNCVAPHKRTSVSTQTPASEESYKVYLYDEISKFLSPKAKNLVYEDLFIYKYSQSKSVCEIKPKRKRHR
ncbi:hypothetical protein evm_004448 [Chilo suppressalis]|nr:hypothetical protein evm_004448 [Chilo suppressalis]